MGATFVLLDTQRGFKFYRAIHFIPTIMIFGAYFFFFLTGWGQRNVKRENKEKVK